MAGFVPEKNARSERLEPARVFVRLEIRAAHVEPERAKHLGEAAHSNPANSHEMDASHAAEEHQASLAVGARTTGAPIPFLAPAPESSVSPTPASASRSAAT